MSSEKTQLTIAIDPNCDPLPAAYGPAELKEIEKRTGSLAGFYHRIQNVLSGFTELGDVLEVLLKAGDPKSGPTRDEIDGWIAEVGIGEAVILLTPFAMKVMGGRDIEPLVDASEAA